MTTRPWDSLRGTSWLRFEAVRASNRGRTGRDLRQRGYVDCSVGFRGAHNAGNREAERLLLTCKHRELRQAGNCHGLVLSWTDRNKPRDALRGALR
ncbi:hypothetical protein NL676_014356 [Syzygium grande]|nr:hypothetical protein NL676_014356 [Syzygium grande]